MQGYITPDTIASEIMMQMAAHKGQFLLLEGSDDIKLYGKFIDRAFCMVIDTRGRPNALGAIDRLISRGVDKAIAIVDDDFESLVAPSKRKNIFVTDENDAEMMLVCSEAFDSFMNERLDIAKWNSFRGDGEKSARDFFLDLGAHLGTFRLMSKRLSLNVDFKSINWGFLNQDSLKCDLNKMADFIYSANQTECMLRGITAAQLLENALAERALDLCSHKLCRGHDITKIIGISLKEKLGNNSNQVMRASEVEAGLRMSYHWSMFKETKLCSNIRYWERDYGRIFRYDG